MSTIEDVEARIAALELKVDQIKVWDNCTAVSDERVTSIPIAIGGAAVTKKVIFSLPLPVVYPGDLIYAHAAFECTNDYTYNVMCARHLLFAPSPTSVSATEMSRPAAPNNITPAMHHEVISDFAAFVVPSLQTHYEVNFVAWAAASQAQAGHTLKIDQGFGKLSVFVIPKDLRASVT